MSTQSEHYVPSGRGPQIIGVYSFFMALTTIVIILRTYVRVVMVKSFGIDDWAMLLGWVLFICYSGFAIGGAFYGTGQHVELIKPASNIPTALMHWWMCEPLYVVGNMAIKLSIGLMLLRLVVEKSHRMLIYIVVGVVQVYSVVYFFLFVFQCIPSRFFWTRMGGDTNGQCMSPVVIVDATYIYSAITCAGDWVLAIMPWFLVRNLQMNRRTKSMVAIILAMGSIASAATIVRIPYVADLANVADFLYATTDVAIWSCVETGLAIAASSAATLKPLFKKFLDRSRAYHSKTKSMPLKSDQWPKRSNGRSSYIRTNSAEPSIESRQDIEMDKNSNITKTFEVSVRREHAP